MQNKKRTVLKYCSLWLPLLDWSSDNLGLRCPTSDSGDKSPYHLLTAANSYCSLNLPQAAVANESVNSRRLKPRCRWLLGKNNLKRNKKRTVPKYCSLWLPLLDWSSDNLGLRCPTSDSGDKSPYHLLTAANSYCSLNLPQAAVANESVNSRRLKPRCRWLLGKNNLKRNKKRTVPKYCSLWLPLLDSNQRQLG